MSARRETEIKLAVEDPRAIKRRIRELGFRPVVARHFESNTVLDLSDRRLFKAGQLLRVRRAGAEGILTFKSAPGRSQRYKVRGESETWVERPEIIERILRMAGFVETFRYEKFRTIYRRRASHQASLMYDETPVGTYLELEGPPSWIDRVAGALGFSRKEYVTATYATLYFQRCAELGRKPGNMVFPARIPRRKS